MHRLRLISIQHTELRRVCEHICDKLIVYTRTISIYSPTYKGAYIYMHIYHVYCSCTYIHTIQSLIHTMPAIVYTYIYIHIYISTSLGHIIVLLLVSSSFRCSCCSSSFSCISFCISL